MNSLEKKWIIIQAYKHNEELHRQWTHSYVLRDDEEYFILASIRAAVVESDGRKWHTKEPAIFVLSKKNWFNVIAMLKENGVCYYVNIASPAIFDRNFIKYIDYDLDLRVFPDGGFRVLDRNEYNYHKKIMGYSNEIDCIVKSELSNLIELKKAGVGPFEPGVIRKYYDIYKNL